MRDCLQLNSPKRKGTTLHDSRRPTEAYQSHVRQGSGDRARVAHNQALAGRLKRTSCMRHRTPLRGCTLEKRGSGFRGELRAVVCSRGTHPEPRLPEQSL